MTSMEEAGDASAASAVIVTPVHVVVSVRVAAVHHGMNRGLDQLPNARRRGQEDQREAPAQE